MTERMINAERIEQIINVFGSFDENIKRIEQTFHVKITNRGTELKIVGDEEAADDYPTFCKKAADTAIRVLMRFLDAWQDKPQGKEETL